MRTPPRIVRRSEAATAAVRRTSSWLASLPATFVMQAIAELGFKGFVSHEYSPSQGNDPIAMLAKAMEICDV